MRPHLAILASMIALGGAARALPRAGGAMPAFAVDDIAGSRHTQADLRGHWSVALVMTDKDVKDDLEAWWHRLEGAVARPARLYTFGALNIFPLVPTGSIVAEARGSTPRPLWSSVWLSRDGSFARSLDLPEEELPWIVVVDPAGHVALTLHERVSDAAVARVLATLAP